MKLYIKNMVCNRCIAAVEKVLTDFRMKFSAVELGEVEIKNHLEAEDLQELNQRLTEAGFEILEDAAHQLIAKVKKELILLIDGLDIPEDFILSKFISEKLHRDYSSISKLFSQNQGSTLEQFFILQKIEKVKELLFYNEFSLTEISGKLGYKSVQHLSAQFRNTTGFTPTEFKKMKGENRLPLDKF